jgi:rod shape-determining protein MreD
MRAAAAQTMRPDVSVTRFHPAALVGIPLLAIFLQAFLPIKFSFMRHFDLPLLATIFFAMSRRSQVQGLLTGATIGLVQDSLSPDGLPIGLYGLSKTMVGYVASSLSAKIDSESPGSRLLLTFGFFLMHQFIYFSVARGMVQLDTRWQWQLELLNGALNAVLAVPLFMLLDKLKRRG